MRHRSASRHAAFAIVAVMLVASTAGAKTHTIALTSKSFDGQTAGVVAGDTICLSAGSRSNLTIKNVTGSAAAPVVIKNCGGRVTIDTATSHGLLILASTHFQLTGSGDAAQTYGIYIGKTPQGSQGLALTGKSSDYEVDHLELEASGFAGIMSKTDPSCSEPDLRGFVQRKTHFHHNFIHDTGGEGFYVGYSWWPERKDVDCTGTLKTFYPHDIEGISIHHNRIERTGWDALQLGCATKDAAIHHNVIRDYGLAKVQYQTSGMQINAGTAAHIYANDLRQGEGGGLIVFGLGGNRIYNNLIVDVGGAGIYVGDAANKPAAFELLNNTIVRPKDDGIRFASRVTKANLVWNNLVIAPGSGKAVVKVYNTVELLEAKNLSPTLAAALFVDAAKGDFHLQAGSPAVDSGDDVSGHGITDDLDGLPRPDPKKQTDVGAYERHETPPQLDAGVTSDSQVSIDDGGVAPFEAGVATDGSVPSHDQGSTPGGDASSTSSSDGCAVAAQPAGPSSALWVLLLALALAWMRRRPS